MKSSSTPSLAQSSIGLKNSINDSAIISFCQDGVVFTCKEDKSKILSLLINLADKVIWLSFIVGSTTSIIAAREVVEVEHAVLHFDNLRRDLNSEDCDRIYRTLTGETCPFTGIKDTKSLLAGIQTEMPELTVGSYFKVLEVIGKKNVAIKIHDNFHNDREEILAVKKCIICGNTDKNEGK